MKELRHTLNELVDQVETIPKLNKTIRTLKDMVSGHKGHIARLETLVVELREENLELQAKYNKQLKFESQVVDVLTYHRAALDRPEIII